MTQNPLIPRALRADMTAACHFPILLAKCFLALALLLAETIFADLDFFKSVFFRPPRVLVLVPLKTCHFFPLTETFIAFFIFIAFMADIAFMAFIAFIDIFFI